jgi:K+/H+ antiporter YhaU regulatory subunit KhtT
VLMLTEGLNIFRHKVHLHLVGKTLIDSGIRENTGCSVIAVRRLGRMLINPDPNEPLQTDDEMIMIGTAESEKTFTAMYPEKG